MGFVTGWCWGGYEIFMSSVKSVLQTQRSVLEKEVTNLVYQIPCRDCDSVYIDETGHSLDSRKCEHVAAVRKFDTKNSALCQHVVENDYFTDWENTKILRESHNVAQT